MQMPTFSFNYDLAAVADVMTNLFDGAWGIIAFAVGIPLAFTFANRVKGLFD